MTKIEITLQDDGQVFVNGPITDAILFNGLLELAKEVASEARKSARKNNIVVSKILPPRKM